MTHARARYRVQGYPCTVPGCGQPRQRLGQYCKQHDRVNTQTGDPLGQTIRKRDLKPYKEEAFAYIQKHHEHTSIQAALGWIGELIQAARMPVYTPTTKRQRLNEWLCKMRGAAIQPEEVLAVVVGMYLMQECDGRRFRSDRHFKHQWAVRVLRLIPAPFYQGWNKGEGRRYYRPLTVGVRELLAWEFLTALGAFPLRIARRMVEIRDKELVKKLAGLDVPFEE